jgi:hypothetical protein
MSCENKVSEFGINGKTGKLEKRHFTGDRCVTFSVQRG